MYLKLKIDGKPFNFEEFYDDNKATGYPDKDFLIIKLNKTITTQDLEKFKITTESQKNLQEFVKQMQKLNSSLEEESEEKSSEEEDPFKNKMQVRKKKTPPTYS